MLDGQCPRVVEPREPATETTLEDVLARNLSIHGAPHARAYAGRKLPSNNARWALVGRKGGIINV